jgi:hypothetical protein
LTSWSVWADGILKRHSSNTAINQPRTSHVELMVGRRGQYRV